MVDVGMACTADPLELILEAQKVEGSHACMFQLIPWMMSNIILRGGDNSFYKIDTD